MVRHNITKYVEDNELVAEAWLQIDLFGFTFCFSRQKVKISTLENADF
ncbi:MAG: hypothetical protein GXZ11_05805 [Tissierellia bacterium]|nr:hypothetical protein [Tissierellia bacterium]